MKTLSKVLLLTSLLSANAFSMGTADIKHSYTPRRLESGQTVITEYELFKGPNITTIHDPWKGNHDIRINPINGYTYNYTTLSKERYEASSNFMSDMFEPRTFILHKMTPYEQLVALKAFSVSFQVFFNKVICNHAEIENARKDNRPYAELMERYTLDCEDRLFNDIVQHAHAFHCLDTTPNGHKWESIKKVAQRRGIMLDVHSSDPALKENGFYDRHSNYHLQVDAWGRIKELPLHEEQINLTVSDSPFQVLNVRRETPNLPLKKQDCMRFVEETMTDDPYPNRGHLTADDMFSKLGERPLNIKPRAREDRK